MQALYKNENEKYFSKEVDSVSTIIYKEKISMSKLRTWDLVSFSSFYFHFIFIFIFTSLYLGLESSVTLWSQLSQTGHNASQNSHIT